MRHKIIFIVAAFGVLVIGAIVLVWVNFTSTTVDPDSLDVAVSPRELGDNPCLYPQPSHRELDETEAVAAAECFVIENGYTDLPASTNPSKIVPENIDPMTDDFGMKLRRDRLERRAATATRDPYAWGGSWIIMFPLKGSEAEKYYSQGLSHTWGRAVIMDLRGRDPRISHTQKPMIRPGARLLYDWKMTNRQFE